jgi:hypothetical protein
MIRIAFRAATVALVLAAAGAALPAAQAQVLSYEQVRDCYCVEQNMTRWRGEVAARSDAVRDHQVELDQAKRQLAAARASANPDNEAQLDNIRNLIDRVTQLRTQLQTTVVPSHNAAVATLNALVDRYNSQCVTAIIFKEMLQRAAAAGVCPPPQ